MVIFKFRNLNSGQATPIPPGEFTVGRADEAYVHLEDASVSRRHAVLINQEDSLFIEDVGSANGISMGGGLILGRVQIKIGDVLNVGTVPFRVDPEIAGEPAAPPSAGMRAINRAYMRKDTERLPAGEFVREVETIAPDKLSLSKIDRATDADADELNEITIREPKTTPTQSGKLPIPRSGLSVTPQPHLASQALPVPRPQHLSMLRTNKEVESARPAASSFSSGPSLKEVQQRNITAIPKSAPVAESEPAPVVAATEYSTGVSRNWLIVTFLAGMGLGLLLGLIFARMFIELGGKAAGLP